MSHMSVLDQKQGYCLVFASYLLQNNKPIHVILALNEEKYLALKNSNRSLNSNDFSNDDVISFLQEAAPKPEEITSAKNFFQHHFLRDKNSKKL